ncbi:hypothetical protein BaRGS_00040441 [Batillaria attramentaria]|uniref:Tudor domain-containing protein n=1 Tax=Batillaria attramentaria TaxID=370345 RepID=A0ABD0J043_9CAEN
MSGNLKQVLVFDEDQSSILPAEGESVAVEVSSVRTPSHFYVTLPWGSLTIPQVTSMSSGPANIEFYKGKRLDTDYSVYAMGEAVAAYCKRSKAWLRAKVVDTDPDEEEVLVMYVDFGDKEWVSERDIRQLDKCFIHLPPQAVECSLVKVIPPRPRVAWPAESRREFWSLVNKKTLVARVVKRMWSGRLMVELFDTSSGEDVDIGATLIRRNLASLDTSSPISQLMSPGDGGDQVHYIPG